MRFEILKYDDIKNMMDEWLRLQKGEDMTFFQSFEWNVMLVNQFNKQWKRRFYRKVRYACVFEQDRLVVAAPLRVKRLVKRNRVVKEVELLGTDSFSDYVNCIYSDANDEYFDCLLCGIADKWRGYVMNWGSIPHETAFGRYLCRKYDGNAYDSEKTVVISLKDFESFEDYFKSLSKSTRQNYRTACNRMNRDGVSFGFEIFDGRLEDALIDTLLMINLERTVEKNSDSFSSKRAVAREKYILKHKSIVRDMMNGMQSCWTLVTYIDEKEAGFLTGAKKDGIIYVVMNKVKPEYEFYSPMIVAIIQLIEKILENKNVDVLDFGRGTEQYKYNIGGKDNDLIDFRIETADIYK